MPELTTSIAKTKPRGDAHLFSHVFRGERGEQAITLLRMDGRERETEQCVQEWYAVLERALLQGEGDPYERLEGTLKELNGLLKGTLISGNVQEVNAIISLWDGASTLHIAQEGRAEAYLTRSGSTVQITESAGTSRDRAQFLHISTGAIQEGDVVILCTERLLRVMTAAQITQLMRRRGEALEGIRDVLEAEKEAGVIALLAHPSREQAEVPPDRAHPARRKGIPLLQRMRGKRPAWNVWTSFRKLDRSFGETFSGLKRRVRKFFDDLQHPTRKRRAHLLLIAGAIVVFIGIWAGFQISTVSKKSQTRAELEELVEKINGDLKLAENRQLMGDLESANAILARAEQEARNVMQNESNLFRAEALDILDRIRTEREAINNIVRLTPTIAANLSARNPDVSARGLIGIERGRLIAYDRQNLYAVIVNAADEPQRLDGENLILDGANFERVKTQVFLTKENRLIELIEGQPTAMKTDDPAGWLTGPDFETYLRYLYLLSPQNNQILKYERLSNRYSAPSEYNVNGKLEDAIDMTIDADIYVLHQGGAVTKLLRGEVKPFTIRNLPEGALTKATRIFKASDRGNFYFLDPGGKRVIVTRTDTDDGESLYLKQFVLEGEQVGTLQDLWVDPEETQLFVLDEKRIFTISLQQG